MEINEETAEKAWVKALNLTLKKGRDFTDKDKRACREQMNLVIKVNKTKDITDPIKKINSFEKWVYPPLEELKAIVLNKKEIPGYYYNYGARAFCFAGVINQIDDYIIPLLKKDKTSRRASIVFYNPEKDSFLHKKDVPAMIMMNFNIINDLVCVTSLVRSNDLFFGWPANIYQSHVLQDYISKKLGLKNGSLTTISISAHIFEDQFEYIKKLVK